METMEDLVTAFVRQKAAMEDGMRAWHATCNVPAYAIAREQAREHLEKFAVSDEVQTSLDVVVNAMERVSKAINERKAQMKGVGQRGDVLQLEAQKDRLVKELSSAEKQCAEMEKSQSKVVEDVLETSHMAEATVEKEREIVDLRRKQECFFITTGLMWDKSNRADGSLAGFVINPKKKKDLTTFQIDASDLNTDGCATRNMLWDYIGAGVNPKYKDA